jgi:uncharacterized protein (DUF2147 family)
MKNLFLKATLVLFISILSAPFSTFAQEVEADALVGVWEPSNKRIKVKIDKIGNKYYGKIVWLKEPKDEQGNPKTDKNNPDKEMQSVPLLGYRMLKDFNYKGKSVWEDGTIYDPLNGSTYNCTIKMIDENTLDIRGYIGVSTFGRTDTWTRLQKKAN